jgi:hypothetical protein
MSDRVSAGVMLLALLPSGRDMPVPTTLPGRAPSELV